jgi:hypothetical protein
MVILRTSILGEKKGSKIYQNELNELRNLEWKVFKFSNQVFVSVQIRSSMVFQGSDESRSCKLAISESSSFRLACRDCRDCRVKQAVRGEIVAATQL